MAKAVAMRLEAMYEQDCCDVSDGFRPGRSPHHALHEGRQGMLKNGMGSVIACDISAFVDNVPHDTLRTILCKRIKDGRVLELIERWLQAGILDGQERVCPDKGRPQGSVRSPLLANVYVHEVLDTWCETVGQAHCRGKVVLYRYADDVVIGGEREEDARRLTEVRPQRFAKYGLESNTEKTTGVRCGRPQRSSAERQPGPAAFWALSTTGARPGEAAPPSHGRRRARGSAAAWASAGVGAGTTAPDHARNRTHDGVRSCGGMTSMTAYGVTAHASTWCTMRQRAPGGTG